MSMHEIEDLVEASIRALDALEVDHDLDLRSAFHKLYEFQACFDCSFTNFRVMDILQKRGYSYSLSSKEHPDYEQYQEYFDRLEGFEHICVVPGEAWDRESNPTAGYFQDGVLYCDLESPLWERLVREGILTGEDARPLEPLKLSQVVAVILSLAEEKGDKHLIRMWYPVFPIGAMYLEDLVEPEPLRGEPSVREIREITRRTGALDIEITRGFLTMPSAKDVEGMPLMEWWFDLDDDRPKPTRPTRPTKPTEPTDFFGETSLIAAAKAGDVEKVRALVEGGADVNRSVMGISVLMSALEYARDRPQARESYLEIVEILLEHGAQVNHRAGNGLAALHDAITLRDPQAVRLLLDAGAEVNLPLHRGRDAAPPILHHALEVGNPKVVRLLREHGADPWMPDEEGNTAWQQAFNFGSKEIVGALLDGIDEADVTRDHEGRTLLMWACMYGLEVEAIDRMIDMGADPEKRDSFGSSAVDIAVRNKHEHLMKRFGVESSGVTGDEPRGSLGVIPYMPKEDKKVRKRLGVKRGFLIQNVALDTPADRAGFEVDDVIVELDGVEIENVIGLYKALSRYREGDTVTCKLLRQGQSIEQQVTLKRPSTEIAMKF